MLSLLKICRKSVLYHCVISIFYIWFETISALRKRKTKSRGGRKKFTRDPDSKITEGEVLGSRSDNQEEVKESRQVNDNKGTDSVVALDTDTQAALDELLLKKKAELEGREYVPKQGL